MKKRLLCQRVTNNQRMRGVRGSCLTRGISRNGTAVVELALVLPVMLLISMLTVDFGGTVGTYLVLANAARSGADQGATHNYTDISRSAWEARINAAVQAEMVNFKKYDASLLQTTISTSVNADGSIQVVVDVRYSFQTIVPWPGVPSQLPLHYRMEMRQYQ